MNVYIQQANLFDRKCTNILFCIQRKQDKALWYDFSCPSDKLLLRIYYISFLDYLK